MAVCHWTPSTVIKELQWKLCRAECAATGHVRDSRHMQSQQTTWYNLHSVSSNNLYRKSDAVMPRIEYRISNLNTQSQAWTWDLKSEHGISSLNTGCPVWRGGSTTVYLCMCMSWILDLGSTKFKMDLPDFRKTSPDLRKTSPDLSGKGADTEQKSMENIRSMFHASGLCSILTPLDLVQVKNLQTSCTSVTSLHNWSRKCSTYRHTHTHTFLRIWHWLKLRRLASQDQSLKPVTSAQRV